MDLKELLKEAKMVPSSDPDDPRDTWFGELLSADQLLTTDWPEPVWAVPDLLPVGLAILAGAPKIGKSWLALQVAQSIAAGGLVFDRQVEQGPVLYLALEDPPRRLKGRMQLQGWQPGLDADFLTIGSFLDRVGDLRYGGADRIARQIERRGYRYVVIDTLSRALYIDQNDVKEVTFSLSPLQEAAHNLNCAVLLVDHHKKSSGFDHDAIADILGSTGKGATADTIIGLYRVRGRAGVTLKVTGREVVENTLNLRMDWQLGCWQLDEGDEGLPETQKMILQTLEEEGPCGPSIISRNTKMTRGNVGHHLIQLEKRGLVFKKGKSWDIYRRQEDEE